MRTRFIISIVACFALSACLAAVYAPSGTAHAAPVSVQSATADTALASGEVSAASAASAVKKAPKPKAISKFKATSLPSGKIRLSWSAKKVKGLKSQTYTVRYVSNARVLWDGKTKKTAKTTTTIPIKWWRGKGWKFPAPWEVQIRTNAKYGKKTVHSKWVSYDVDPADGYRPDRVTSLDTSYYGGNYEAWCQGWVPRSVQLSSTEAGKVEVTWKKSKKHKGISNSEYVVRYSYKKSMKGAKKIETGDTGATIEGLKNGKRVYVQVCLAQWSGLNGKYTTASRWTDKKSVTVSSATVASTDEESSTVSQQP